MNIYADEKHSRQDNQEWTKQRKITVHECNALKSDWRNELPRCKLRSVETVDVGLSKCGKGKVTKRGNDDHMQCDGSCDECMNKANEELMRLVDSLRKPIVINENLEVVMMVLKVITFGEEPSRWGVLDLQWT